jgi:hypothetical protein
MSFGDETLRYLYWSTCFSIRVSGSDSPIRTWSAPNKGGLRMMFGYETTSIDHAGYGKFFWQEWNKNKTFARAFLDASCRRRNGHSTRPQRSSFLVPLWLWQKDLATLLF